MPMLPLGTHGFPEIIVSHSVKPFGEERAKRFPECLLDGLLASVP